MITVTRCAHCEGLVVEGLTIDRRTGVLRWADRSVALQPAELAVLERLILAEGRLVRLEQLVIAVWGNRPGGGPDTAYDALKVYVSRIRRKLAAVDAPVFVATTWGRGYWLAQANDLDQGPAQSALEAQREEATEPWPA